MSRILRRFPFFLLMLLVLIGLFYTLANTDPESEELHYHQFMNILEDDVIESLAIEAGRGVWFVEGTYKEEYAQTKENEIEEFTTYAPIDYDEFIRALDVAVEQNEILVLDFKEAPGENMWARALITFIPFLLIIILFFFLMSQSQGGGNKMMNFGKSKAKLVQDDKKKVTFDDVAGADEEKQELVEVVEFLKDPRKFTAVGARIPKGVLLVGPPGTGKTLIGRATAGEAGVPFFSISGSDFVEMFVGVGASRVRDLFENAKKNAPCIIFIDEIDAVGRQRGAGVGGGHDEREQTLNQLLVEMDGFAVNEGIIIIAATNRPDVLDPALLRPGRFDRQITVNRPDLRGREDVLVVHARNKPLASDVDLNIVAKRTPGFSGADLENLLNEAALLAARRNKKEINMLEIDDAVDRVIAGTEKKSRRVSEKEKNIVAYHESGHTIAGYFLEEGDQVHKVTIIPRGQAGGYMVPIPKEDRFMLTEPELKDRMAGLLAGRVAEEIVFGEVSTGASNDFQRVTQMARAMVMQYGMSRLGPIQFGETQGQVFLGRDIGQDRNFSEAIAYEIDQEVQRIILEQYDRCKELLTKHRQHLEAIAQKLLEIETLGAAQIKELIDTGELSSQTEEPTQDSSVSDEDNATNQDVKVQIQSKKDDDVPYDPDQNENKNKDEDNDPSSRN